MSEPPETPTETVPTAQHDEKPSQDQTPLADIVHTDGLVAEFSLSGSPAGFLKIQERHNKTPSHSTNSASSSIIAWINHTDPINTPTIRPTDLHYQPSDNTDSFPEFNNPPSVSSASSINTDGSVPDTVTDCPSIAVIGLHYNVLTDIHALFKNRRIFGYSKCKLDPESEAVVSGRPPTYEELSPLAAAAEEEAEVYVVGEVFADTS